MEAIEIVQTDGKIQKTARKQEATQLLRSDSSDISGNPLDLYTNVTEWRW